VIIASFWAQEKRALNEREQQLVRLHIQLTRTAALIRKSSGTAPKDGTRQIEQLSQLSAALADMLELIEQLGRFDRVPVLDPY
jgi:hypothetical protein